MCEVTLGQPQHEPRDPVTSAEDSYSSSDGSTTESSDGSYDPYPAESSSSAIHQLGKTILGNETAIWQQELISALPNEQLDHLVKRDTQIRRINRNVNGLEAQSFPLKLHAMLDDSESEGFTDVVSWQRGEQSFKVHKPVVFANDIMSRYFRQTKYKSFQRQLNLYGFTRIPHGPNKNGYEHRFFAKERPSLLDAMTRQKLQTKKGHIKGVPTLLKFCTTKKITAEAVAVKKHHRAPSDLSMDLFNSSMDLSILDVHDKAHELAGMIFTNAGLKDEAHNVGQSELLTNFLLDGDDTRQHKRQDSGIFDDIEDNPVFRALLQDSFLTIGEDDIVADVGDEDISDMFDKEHEIPEDAVLSMSDPIPSIDESPCPVSGPNEHGFPWKLHDMLCESERDGFQHIVSWGADGTVFCVHDQKEFVDKVMPTYFDQTKYDSFRRQLNLYGFTRVVRGPLRGNYMHKSFSRNERMLCKDIVRNAAPKSAKS